MEALSIVTITILYVFGCYLTYADMKDKWYYIPVGVLLGAIICLVWFGSCKWIADNETDPVKVKEKLLVLNLIWDTIQVAVYYGIPILFFGVRMDKIGYIGAGLILAGIVILKIRS